MGATNSPQLSTLSANGANGELLLIAYPFCLPLDCLGFLIADSIALACVQGCATVMLPPLDAGRSLGVRNNQGFYNAGQHMPSCALTSLVCARKSFALLRRDSSCGFAQFGTTSIPV